MDSSPGKSVQVEVSSCKFDLFSLRGEEFSASLLQRDRTELLQTPMTVKSQCPTGLHGYCYPCSHSLLSGRQPGLPYWRNWASTLRWNWRGFMAYTRCFGSVCVLLQYIEGRLQSTPSSNAKIKCSLGLMISAKAGPRR